MAMRSYIVGLLRGLSFGALIGPQAPRMSAASVSAARWHMVVS